MADENKKLDAWIAENVTEDTKEVMIIGNTASEEALSKLNIGLSAEMALSLYGIVYAEIIDKLRNLRSDNPSFIIQIANIVAIGYDNTEEDEDTETQGNFNIVMQEIGKAPTYIDSPDMYSAERCTVWMDTNIENQRKIISDIATAAIKSLDEKANLVLGQPEVVFPLWSLVHQAMTNFMKIKRAEVNSSDYFINFLNCYEVHCQLLEDNECAITYKPSISGKTGIKSNMIASSAAE